MWITSPLCVSKGPCYSKSSCCPWPPISPQCSPLSWRMLAMNKRNSLFATFFFFFFWLDNTIRQLSGNNKVIAHFPWSRTQPMKYRHLSLEIILKYNMHISQEFRDGTKLSFSQLCNLLSIVFLLFLASLSYYLTVFRRTTSLLTLKSLCLLLGEFKQRQWITNLVINRSKIFYALDCA